MEILGSELNLIAVLLSIVLAFVLGAVWYTQILFGKKWQKLVGLSDQQLTKGMKSSMGFGFLAIALMVFGYGMLRGWLLTPMAVALQNDSVIVVSAVIALVLWGFMLFPSIWLNNNYALRGWQLTAIDAGYQLLLLLVSAVVFSVI